MINEEKIRNYAMRFVEDEIDSITKAIEVAKIECEKPILEQRKKELEIDLQDLRRLEWQYSCAEEY